MFSRNQPTPSTVSSLFVVFSHGCRNPVLSVCDGLLNPDAGSCISFFL